MAEAPVISIVARPTDRPVATTPFFRDAEAFAALATDVFASLTQGRSARETLRAWVPACATGEEAYSIALAYSEFCADSGCDVPLHVVGTDVDAACIEAARRGLYRDSGMQGVSSARRERWFIATGGGWRVGKSLRDCCTFLQHDVLAGPPLSGSDLVSFRHVLTGVRRDLRGEALAKLHAALQPGGMLWLGAAEAADAARELFELRSARTRAYVKVCPGRRRDEFGTVLDISRSRGPAV